MWQRDAPWCVSTKLKADIFQVLRLWLSYLWWCSLNNFCGCCFLDLTEKQRRKPLSQQDLCNLDSWHRSVGDHRLPGGKGKMPSLLLTSAKVSGAHALLMGLEVPANNRDYSSSAILHQGPICYRGKELFRFNVNDCTRMWNVSDMAQTAWLVLRWSLVN